MYDITHSRDRYYNISPNVLVQTDIRFDRSRSILESLASSNAWIPESADETVMVLALEGTIRELNLVGALIWEELARSGNPQCAVEVLEKAFDVDTAQARSDVEAFLSELLDKGLIKKVKERDE